ncbi:hypothetical protein [Candidatus Phyllobacterium onerii]|uniref:hypothetical protein n=1 Tax=Candidatus Phyllobacterium onerii TaxID=3020828 RepID=UPI00233047A4|nr:hypothetical protein [Phyllobacterium sp. IY22]
MNIEVQDASFLVHQKLHLIASSEIRFNPDPERQRIVGHRVRCFKGKLPSGELIELTVAPRLELDSELRIFTEQSAKFHAEIWVTDGSVRADVKVSHNAPTLITIDNELITVLAELHRTAVAANRLPFSFDGRHVSREEVSFLRQSRLW